MKLTAAITLSVVLLGVAMVAQSQSPDNGPVSPSGQVIQTPGAERRGGIESMISSMLGGGGGEGGKGKGGKGKKGGGPPPPAPYIVPVYSQPPSYGGYGGAPSYGGGSYGQPYGGGYGGAPSYGGGSYGGYAGGPTPGR